MKSNEMSTMSLNSCLQRFYSLSVYKCKCDMFLICTVLVFLFRGGSFTADHPDSSRPPTASSSRSDLVYSGRQQKSWNFDGYSSDNDVMLCFGSF